MDEAPSPDGSIERDVEAYAALAAALAALHDETARARLLASHGLDEEGWDTIDDTWQERIAQGDDDGDRVPPLLARYADAFARACAAGATGAPPLSFERFVQATRELRRGVDMTTALDRLGLDLGAYLRAQRHWTDRMVRDPELASRFEDSMR